MILKLTVLHVLMPPKKCDVRLLVHAKRIYAPICLKRLQNRYCVTQRVARDVQFIIENGLGFLIKAGFQDIDCAHDSSYRVRRG